MKKLGPKFSPSTMDGLFSELSWTNFLPVPFAALIIELIFLAAYMSQTPPASITVITDPIDIVGFYNCTFPQGKVFTSLQFIIFGILLCLILYYARHTQEYWDRISLPNESKAIIWTVYAMALCSLVLVPVISFVGASDPNAYFFALELLALIPMVFALVTIFGHRILIILRFTRFIKFFKKTSRKFFGNASDGVELADMSTRGRDASNIGFKLDDTKARSESVDGPNGDPAKNDSLIWKKDSVSLRNRKLTEEPTTPSTPSIVRARVGSDLRIVTEEVLPEDLER